MVVVKVFLLQVWRREMSLSEVLCQEIERRAQEDGELHSRKGFLEGNKDSLLVIEVAPCSATTVWIDGPMARVYVRYLGSYRGRNTTHYLFQTETGTKIALTEFEVTNVKVRVSRESAEDRCNLYLTPTRRARNYYVDYGQEEL